MSFVLHLINHILWGCFACFLFVVIPLGAIRLAVKEHREMTKGRIARMTLEEQLALAHRNLDYVECNRLRDEMNKRHA